MRSRKGKGKEFKKEIVQRRMMDFMKMISRIMRRMRRKSLKIV